MIQSYTANLLYHGTVLNTVCDYSQRSPVTASSYRVDRIGMQFDDCMPSYVVSRIFSPNLLIQLDAGQKSNFENCLPMRSSAVICDYF